MLYKNITNGKPNGQGAPSHSPKPKKVARGATFIRDYAWDVLQDPMSFTLFYLIKRFRFLPWIRKQGGWKPKDILWLAKKMGASRPSAYRYLKALISCGVVERVGGLYRPLEDRKIKALVKEARRQAVSPVRQPRLTSETSQLPQTPVPIAPEAQFPPLVYKDFTSTSYINTHIQASKPPYKDSPRGRIPKEDQREEAKQWPGPELERLEAIREEPAKMGEAPFEPGPAEVNEYVDPRLRLTADEATFRYLCKHGKQIPAALKREPWRVCLRCKAAKQLNLPPSVSEVEELQKKWLKSIEARSVEYSADMILVEAAA